MFEYIVTRRLVATLQQAGLFESEQYAYLQGRDISQALLDLTLDIKNGFKHDKFTGMIAVDYEGAFDAVWRNGVLYKLAQLGITGRLYLYVHSFLHDRKTRSFVNSCTTEWSDTDIGIPQGSVIGPILYLIFTKDISDILDSHVKFADDLYLSLIHI